MTCTCFVISHDPERYSVLTNVAGRSVLGHVLDQLRRIDDTAAVVVTSPTPNADLQQWCRWSGIEILSNMSHQELYDRGYSHLVRVSAHVALLPLREVYAALCLARARLGRVRVGLREDLPLGAFADVLSAEGSGAPYDLEATGIAADPSVSVLIDGPETASALETLIDRSGRMPADLRPSDAIRFERSVWRGEAGPMMIAEIGGNHEGDFNTALRMTEQAIRSGADCVKFQLYQGDTLVSPVESLDRQRHFKKFELAREQHIQLAEMCRAAGVIYLASVWDADMLDWIDPYLDFYKVGSGDLTAWPFLAEMARRGKPILLSTGLATLDEVVQTVDYIRGVNTDYKQRDMLCVMQCTSMYPIPDEDAHLRVMEALENLDVAIGYSDHTIGDRAMVAATAMGASVLEFHFTDRRDGQTFRDHKVSLMEDEVRALKEEIRQVTAFRGSLSKVRQESELAVGHEISFRRAVYTNVDVEPGEILSPDKLVWLRPAHGTDTRDLGRVIGATAKRKVLALAALVAGDDYDPVQ